MTATGWTSGRVRARLAEILVPAGFSKFGKQFVLDAGLRVLVVVEKEQRWGEPLLAIDILLIPPGWTIAPDREAPFLIHWQLQELAGRRQRYSAEGEMNWEKSDIGRDSLLIPSVADRYRQPDVFVDDILVGYIRVGATDFPIGPTFRTSRFLQFQCYRQALSVARWMEDAEREHAVREAIRHAAQEASDEGRLDYQRLLDERQTW